MVNRDKIFGNATPPMTAFFDLIYGMIGTKATGSEEATTTRRETRYDLDETLVDGPRWLPSASRPANRWRYDRWEVEVIYDPSGLGFLRRDVVVMLFNMC